MAAGLGTGRKRHCVKCEVDFNDHVAAGIASGVAFFNQLKILRSYQGVAHDGVHMSREYSAQQRETRDHVHPCFSCYRRGSWSVFLLLLGQQTRVST